MGWALIRSSFPGFFKCSNRANGPAAGASAAWGWACRSPGHWSSCSAGTASTAKSDGPGKGAVLTIELTPLAATIGKELETPGNGSAKETERGDEPLDPIPKLPSNLPSPAGEDHEDTRRIMARLLKSAGYRW